MTRSGYLLAILAPVVVLCAVYVASTPTTAARVGRTTGPDPAPKPFRGDDAPPEIVDAASALTRDLFREDPDTVDLADGPARYQRGLYAAAATEGSADGGLVAKDLIWLANPRPKNAAELERLVFVDPRLSGAEAGAAVRAAFGRVPGVKAARANVVGTLGRRGMKRLELEGAVHATFVDPATPEERVDVLAEKLTVRFENGEPVDATSDAPIRVIRPVRRDAEVYGRGARLVFRRNADGELRLESVHVLEEIALALHDPKGLGLEGPPLRANARGPLVWTPWSAAPGGAASARSQGGEIVLDGGVDGTRGPLEFRAGGGRVALAAPGGRKATFLADRGFVLTGPDAVVEGDSVSFDAGESGRATARGRPIRATLKGLHVPGADLGAETVLTCFGPFTVEPSAGPFAHATGIRRLHASTRVVLTGGGVSLAAGDATVFAGTVAGRRMPLRVALAHGVEGATPEAALKCRELTILREYDADGTPRLETVALKGDYEARFLRSTLIAPDRADSSPASRRAAGPLGLASGADRIVVKGGDRLELLRAVQNDAPTLATTRGGATVRLEESATSRPAAELRARNATLVLRPERETGAQRLDSFSAEGDVVVEIPGVGRATGGVIRLRAVDEELVLDRSEGVGRAEIEIFPRSKTRGARADSFSAERFTWSGPRQRLVAEERVRGEFDADAIPWIGDKSTDSSASDDAPPAKKIARTTLAAARVVVSCDGSGLEPVAVRSVEAEGAVDVRQPARSLIADYARFDLVERSGVLRGSPILLRATRIESGAAFEDRVSAPRASMSEGGLHVEGPAEAVIHVSPERSALRLGAEPKIVQGPPPPMRVYCMDGAVFRDNLLRLAGRVEAAQGDRASDGFTAACDEAFLHMAPESPEGPLALEFAAFRGGVVFRSARLEAAADVLKVDRVRRKATLYNERPEPVSLRVDGLAHLAPVDAGASGMTVDFAREKVSVTIMDAFAIQRDAAASRPATNR